MRPPLFVNAVALVAALLTTAPSIARAEPPAESARPPIDVAIFGSLISVGVGSGRNYTGVGAVAHAHVYPWLRVGVRFAIASEQDLFEDAGEQTQPDRTLDVGAHAEAHARPKQFLDPWLGIGLGVRRVSQARTDYDGNATSGGAPVYGSDPPGGICRTDEPCWTGLVSAELGLDFHPHPNVAFGPFVFVRTPVPRDRPVGDRGASGGHLRQEASFHFLLPGLRVMAIF